LTECEIDFAKHCESDGIFLTFKLNVKNTPQNIVNPAKRCYGSE
jgi:hypothetical protein